MSFHFSKFPSIEQYRHTVKDVTNLARYAGMNDQGQPIFDPSRKLPKITFTGTVKLHGTNAGVGYERERGIWAQSRSRVLKPDEPDNCGFRAFVQKNELAFKNICEMIPHLPGDMVFLYGEWIGEGIQKNVAVVRLPRRFVIFAAKVIHFDVNGTESMELWLSNELVLSTLKNPDASIYNIHDFKTWSIDIDFELPEESQDTLERITTEVEQECPVAKAFGVSGTGEGVVWHHSSRDHGTIRFKVKGEKHLVTKVKNSASCKLEIAAGANDFVNKTVTENRLEQAAQEIFGENQRSIYKTREMIAWVLKDIFKEESDMLAESNLTQKDVKQLIGGAVRMWLANQSK